MRDSSDDFFKQLSESINAGKEKLHNSPDVNYFIVSKKWLTQLENNSLDRETLNSDIVLHQPNTIFKYQPLNSHMWNKILKPDLKEGLDYEILDFESWSLISNKYATQHTIQRDSYIQDGIKHINVYPIALQIGAIFPSCINKLKSGKRSTIISGKQYVTTQFKLQQFIELLEDTLPTVNSFNFVHKNAVRLYKCPPAMTINDVEARITEEMKDLGYQDEPMFEIKELEYLDPKVYDTIGDINLEPEQVILADFKEVQKNWCIKNANFPLEAKCESCYNYRVLTHPCECKRVSYCSEDCKKRDENYHLPKCEKTDSDDETMNKLQRTEESKDGKVGIKNLGNTCFMNSGLQCLSNTQPIREYILSNQYKNDINHENTLGTKGELCTKFGNLLRRMWYDTKSSIPPYSLKRAIGKFQPQFQGYQQHDSQELITYLLDGLHEDLNRIKVKPYVERQDYNNRPDQEVAKESWQQFRQRNDSIIVDNMYGMYKSKLQCPTCQQISITFDPFLMVSVSIPQNNLKAIQINFINPQVLWDCQTIDYTYSKSQDLTLRQVLEDPLVSPKLLNIALEDFIYLCSSSYQHDSTDLNEKLSDLKKKLKYKKLYLRKSLPQEQNIDKDKKVEIFIHEAYKQYATYQWKRDLTPSLNFLFTKESTPWDLHKLCYDMHIGLLPQFEGIKPQADDQSFEDYYKENILDIVYSLDWKSNQNYQMDCAFCLAKQCNDCQVSLSKEEKFEVYFERDPKIQLEVYVVWKRGFKLNGSTEELYNDWLKSQTKQQQEIKEPKQQQQEETQDPPTDVTTDEMRVQEEQTEIGPQPQNNYVIALPSGPQTMKNNPAQGPPMSLGECLQFSQKPEQLEQDNTWYCNQCKDHVQAFKTMEIYQVPNILMFHLKRFKNSNKFFKSKLETLITFPVEALDMTNYVLNHNLPQIFEGQEIHQEGPLLYDLYAVANHFGGLGGGHYTAYAKNIYDQEWYNFDDSFVSKIPKDSVEQTVVQNSAYVLFYKKRQ